MLKNNYFITLGLLVWLLIDNSYQIDFASTKNQRFINAEKMKVDSFQDIDSVKIYAKSKLDVIRQERIRNSTIASKRVQIIVGLIILQMILLIYSLISNERYEKI